ncbi:MAG TPA: hypothetical protein VFC51_08530 [Chloroflexota bacterium]|nr:hypothetical protein [Chloroflexota bacterium]
MLGFRARVGYTAPVTAVETFPFEFYRMAPEGVSLMVATTVRARGTEADVEETFDRSLAAAREMAAAGASVIVLGGASPGFAFGMDRLADAQQAISRDFGIPVTTALDAQVSALRALGAKRVAVVTPFAATPTREFARISQFGFEVVGVGGGNYSHADFGRVATDAPSHVARKLVHEHPAADTIFFPAAHWPAASNVDALERELGVNAIASAQAIVWQALRMCNIDDRVEGYGRLLREH